MVMRDKAILIYDGVCSYCRRFAQAARWLNRRGSLQILPFQGKDAQALLQAQFGAQTGFTMYLFKRGEVHWAQAAARETVTHLSLPRWLGWLAFRVYPAVVSMVSRLTGRRQAVCMPGQGACATAQAASGSMRLTPQAFAQLSALGR